MPYEELIEFAEMIPVIQAQESLAMQGAIQRAMAGKNDHALRQETRRLQRIAQSRSNRRREKPFEQRLANLKSMGIKVVHKPKKGSA